MILGFSEIAERSSFGLERAGQILHKFTWDGEEFVEQK